MNKNQFLVLFVACFLVACGAPEKLTEDGKKNLSEQIAQLETSEAFNLKGKTPTEELLYLLELPTQMKSATLIVLDGQLETLEASGREKEANELRNNRQLLLKAMDENMASYVESAAEIYEQIFTGPEIARMNELYRDPVMRKAVSTQLNIQQKIIPVAETWGQKVGKRYEELLSEKSDKD
ncbi:DUF2059 domain-containing protein [Hellea balneolensis]|uniref:DUF2059 domain-containing protein n=1 Tax=Hellea balneolensis TaxID=287478 RepID=UPI00047D41E6|nr:DUF2059 domain-containing protein [Hellea balneolensis]